MAESKSWQEKRGFHPQDAIWRRAGFRIHSRPSNGPAVWERDGELYSENDTRALRDLARRDKDEV